MYVVFDAFARTRPTMLLALAAAHAYAYARACE